MNEDNEREVTWVNTNLLLEIDEFIGMKTGVTPTAGPCLTVAYIYKFNITETIRINLS